jgi:hypothetical protein
MAGRRRDVKKEPEREVAAPSPAAAVRSYEDMGDEVDDEHPVDALVERRLDHAALRRRIRAATDRLVEALDEEHDLWLRLEELLGEQRLDREAAYFDVGYEHGRAAGRAEALAERGPHGTAAYRDLAQRLREAAVNAGLPHDSATAALLEAAWAILADARAPRPGKPQPKDARG